MPDPSASPPSPTRYRRADGTVHRWVAGTVVLVDASGRARDLQGGAAIVWEVLDRPSTLTEVAESLTEVLGPEGAPPPAALAEAMDLLVADGLVTLG